MPSIRRIKELSALAVLPPDQAIERALAVLREALEANEVFLIYGHEGGFRCFGTCPDMGFSDVALWLVHHDLTSRGAPCVFDRIDGHVVNFRSAGSRRPAGYVAAKIPLTSTGDMLVVSGAWRGGLGARRRDFIESSLPALALILERRLDATRAERRRYELSALANITRVLAESEDLEMVLSSIASTIAGVTQIDYASIDILEPDGAFLRCSNFTRPRTEQLREKWRAGANRPDSVRDTVMQTRSPMLLTDAQNDERIPEKGRAFFVRTLIRSAATLPLLSKDEVLGVLSVASHRPLMFAAQEVELLEELAGQVAFAVKGIKLYHQLAESREELQRLNEQLQESMGIEHHLARTDALTGIPNRRFIDESIEAEVARARRYEQPLSVVMADLDELKEINDNYSHLAGDEMLRFVASVARASCRQVDVVGRYGGDEFVFVLPSTKLEEATAFAERFRERVARQAAPNRGGAPLRMTVSLGVAEWDNESMESPSCLLHQSDRAMYEAKAAGRNRTMVAVGDSARAA